MAKFGEEALSILRRALDAFPEGIDSPRDHDTAEYAAFVRVYEASLIDSEIDPMRFYGTTGAHYRDCKITESGRDVLDEANKKLEEVDTDDEPLLLGLKEGRDIVIRHVRNVHGASNGLGIRITIEEVDQATAQINKSNPRVVKKLLTEWIPSSLTSSTMKMLFDILKTALG